MTHSVTLVQLEELTTVRITCNHCGTTIEIPTSALPRFYGRGACRYCEYPWQQSSARMPDPFHQLGEALTRIASMSSNIAVTFPIQKATS